MEEKKSLIDIEKELFIAYGEHYGYGHSVTRQFKAFLINGQRAGDARRMLANAQAEVQAAAKAAAPSAPGVGANVFPAKSPSQPLPKPVAKILPEPLPEPTQPEQAGNAGDVVVDSHFTTIDVLEEIRSGLSNTQMAAKYDREALMVTANHLNATTTPDMSEKQIVAAIKKAMSK